MADGYPDACPECGANMRDGDYYRVIGVSRGDRIVMWVCPDCHCEWSRTEPPATGLRKCPVIRED